MKSRKNKTLKCTGCDEEVHNVGEETLKVTCWRCVSSSLRATPESDSEEEE